MLLVLVLRPLQQLAEELLEASRTGDTAAVLALLDAGADREASDMGGCAALHWAARNGHTATVQALLGAGAECDATFTTHVSPTSGRTPLHWAAQHGHTDAVQALLRVAADTEARDSESRTPLHLAARNGHTETVLKQSGPQTAAAARRCTRQQARVTTPRCGRC
jgi:cytohesin